MYTDSQIKRRKIQFWQTLDVYGSKFKGCKIHFGSPQSEVCKIHFGLSIDLAWLSSYTFHSKIKDGPIVMLQLWWGYLFTKLVLQGASLRDMKIYPKIYRGKATWFQNTNTNWRGSQAIPVKLVRILRGENLHWSLWLSMAQTKQGRDMQRKHNFKNW